jgi:hypothetical protein
MGTARAPRLRKDIAEKIDHSGDGPQVIMSSGRKHLTNPPVREDAFVLR